MTRKPQLVEISVVRAGAFIKTERIVQYESVDEALRVYQVESKEASQEFKTFNPDAWAEVSEDAHGTRISTHG